ncbi:MAG: hypothetical protein GY696_26365 [Gammaproteobacteria bacterium]|nr:hypothetical protein [Gammaproteobacteria bacterium]
MPGSIDRNRLLLEINKSIKELNREQINPAIPELKLDDLVPVMSMVAHARAVYLKKLFDLSGAVGDGMPTTDQIKQLRNQRIVFEELLEGAKALETAIERGYLDITEGSSEKP